MEEQHKYALEWEKKLQIELYCQSSGFPHPELQIGDVYFFLRNNVENHFICSIADKIARIKYLEHQLYAKKTEKSQPKNRPETDINPRNRSRQKRTPGHPFQDGEDKEENSDRINRVDVNICRYIPENSEPLLIVALYIKKI